MAITSDRLLEGVKRRIIIPASNVLMSDTDILAFADDIIKSRVIPLLESVNQEFFVTSEDIDIVAGQSEYSIPYRAIGRALRELKFKDTNSNVRNIAQIAIEDVQVYAPCVLTTGFYFKGDKIHLVPDVPSDINPNQHLQVWYRLPPNNLVPLASAARVTSVSAPNVVVANVPSTLETGSTIDFIQGQSGNSIYSIDQTITNIAGTTITFGASVVPSSLSAGDFISLAQTSPVINFVPNEAYTFIESCTAARVLQAIGDFDGMKMVQEDVSIEQKNLEKIIEPRIDGEPTIIINRTSLVRGRVYQQRSWLYGNS